jgi:hypothetical protein
MSPPSPLNSPSGRTMMQAGTLPVTRTVGHRARPGIQHSGELSPTDLSTQLDRPGLVLGPNGPRFNPGRVRLDTVSPTRCGRFKSGQFRRKAERTTRRLSSRLPSPSTDASPSGTPPTSRTASTRSRAWPPTELPTTPPTAPGSPSRSATDNSLRPPPSALRLPRRAPRVSARRPLPGTRRGGVRGTTQPMAMPKGLAPTPIWVSTLLVAVLIGVTVSLPAVLTYAVVPSGVMAMPNG